MRCISFSRRLLLWLRGLLLLAWGGGAGNLEGQQADPAGSHPLVVSRGDSANVARAPGFTLIEPGTTGILFTNSLPESRHLTNQILLNGSGVAAGDVNGDGTCDLFFCRTDGANALFLNLGNWRFRDSTPGDPQGIACANLTSTGCALVDLDGDDDLDLIVNTLGNGTRVFRNDGRGGFGRPEHVLNRGRGAMSLALGDTDGDGFLDLYVANYRVAGLMDIPNARATFRTVAGQTVMDTFNGRSVRDPDLRDRFAVGPGGSIEENGEADAFYRNVGGTNFVEISFTGGAFLGADGRPLARVPQDWGLSVMMRDVNRDGLPDLYVCNDFQTEDRFWLNQGGGRFRLTASLDLRRTSRFSMGIDFADIDRDGFDDFLVLDMASRSHRQRMREIAESVPGAADGNRIDARPQYGFNTLFRARGDGTYAEIAHYAGLEATDWSWGCVFLDVDLDGWEDVLISNGMERAARDADVVEQLKRLRAGRTLTDSEIFEARRAFPRLASPNLAFRNRGDLTFENVSTAWRFDWAGVSQGIAAADLDGDGDLDLAINNLNAPACILRNDAAAGRIAVRLQGLAPNTRGIGARIRVAVPGLPIQTQEIIAGGRYLSSDEAVRTFAAGSATEGLAIEVLWRSGRISVVTNVAANCRYLVREPASAPTRAPPPPQPPSPLFVDVSTNLAHVHVENSFDDFARQPLLPRRLSESGPGLAWYDVDGDGWEDLLVGSGQGGRLALLRNDRQGGFKFDREPGLGGIAARDQAGILAWRDAAGAPRILLADANYEDGAALGVGLRELDPGDRSVSDIAKAQSTSFGALALGALDGSGPPALFVAGRVRPGAYPAAGDSLLFRRGTNTWQLDSHSSAMFAGVGLVSAAAWSDLTGDGYPELLLACEWGALRLFRNRRGSLEPWDPAIQFERDPATGWAAHLPEPVPARLSQLSGFWLSVTAADLDADGALDFVAGNWGRNSTYEPRRGPAWRILYGDLDGDGVVELVESYHDPETHRYVPWANLTAFARVFPAVRGRYSLHSEFAGAGVEEALGDSLRRLEMREAVCLDSMMFLNRGDHFVARPLPMQAQWSPTFGIAAADYDNDGQVDLFAAQNFFGTPADTPRLDCSQGLLLRGTGRGEVTALSALHSGVRVDGEQRAAAAADYDGDGRMDLAVAQNGGATRLFRNRGAAPGLRVRLLGTDNNRDAIGAWVRLREAGQAGAAQERQCGSGYWAQAGTVMILRRPAAHAEIIVRWPGGAETVTPVSAGATEMEVRAPAR